MTRITKYLHTIVDINVHTYCRVPVRRREELADSESTQVLTECTVQIQAGHVNGHGHGHGHVNGHSTPSVGTPQY